jgi:hypothetical protein
MPVESRELSRIAQASLIKPKKHVVFAQHGNAIVLLDVKASRYYSLNDVGGHIWTLLERGQPFLQLIDALVTEYDVSRERLERDVLSLLTTMDDAGLVSVE